jgi:hypothetical protein
MLPLLPLEIIQYTLVGFDIKYIYSRLRFLNRAHRDMVDHLFNDSNFLARKIIQTLHGISANTAQLVTVEELRTVPLQYLKDLLLLLYMAEHPHPSDSSRVKFFLERVITFPNPVVSYVNVINIIKIRVYGNSLFIGFQNYQTIEEGCELSLNWHKAAPCSASLFAIATFLRFNKAIMEETVVQQCCLSPEVLAASPGTYEFSIRAAIVNIDESLYSQVSYNHHYLNALANLHTHKILEAIKNRITAFTYDDLLSLEFSAIASICARGSVREFEAQVANLRHVNITSRPAL